MMSACRGSWVVALAGALTACGASVRQAVNYRGSEYAERVPADRLRSVSVLPMRYESFGRLAARCTLTPMGTMEGVWLSDVDCSERRLRAAIRSKASAVGAELLVGERCGTRAAGRSNSARSIRCVAQAARVDEGERKARPLDPPAAATGALDEIADANEAASLDDPTGEQAWRIQISYEPSSDTAPRAPRPAAAVGELPTLPVSHVALGMLQSRCAAECSLDAVRAALRVAAGRLGASDVAEVRCVQHSPGITCMGTAAQPEAEL